MSITLLINCYIYQTLNNLFVDNNFKTHTLQKKSSTQDAKGKAAHLKNHTSNYKFENHDINYRCSSMGLFFA